MNDLEKEYIKTNIDHRYYVKFFITKIIEELSHRANVHDSSKYSNDETVGFVKAIPYTNIKWGSTDIPNDIANSLQDSLLIHHSRNDHHPEYFENGIEDMDLIQLLELACDWRAAMIRHKNFDIDETICVGQTRFKFCDSIARILQNTLERIDTYVDAAEIVKPKM